MSEAYRKAGVDIDAGNEAVERMKSHVQRTFRPEVLTGLGGFGGMFQLEPKKYEEPILVSGTDGVGTKLKLAFALDKHDTIGIDAVAMCVNDIVVQGAEPLFFLDYLACAKVSPGQIEDIVKGVADGCEQAGCALIGGETAEMPGMYQGGEYDIAGFSVGVVDRKNIIDGETMQKGDVVIGLASSGIHSNGYSLVRKVLLEDNDLSLDSKIPSLNQAFLDRPAVSPGKTFVAKSDSVKANENSLGEELLTPTRIYVKPLLNLLNRHEIKGLAHITGGGFYENIPRILPQGAGVEIENGSWPVQPIFQLIQEYGNISREDMFRTFNMGIGMAVIVGSEIADQVIQELESLGEKAYKIGRIMEGNREVRFGGVCE